METRYKAFLSYSHKDEAFARWLHREIEQWKVPKDLVGRQTHRGPVPRSLRPVFRDRDDFAGGASLRDATVRALEAAEFLVVLCSPNSAQSRYVSEEVRLFKALGRGDRIIPVIIAGEPGDPDAECFPPAVRQAIGSDGQLTDETEEPIAADARDAGDGRQRAAAKVVAGLLGVAFDEIIRRAEIDRRRRRATWAGLGTGAVVFATALSSFALYRTHEASLAIDRSLFALGGIVQRVGELPTEGELGETRAEILMSQCDIMESLARDRREVNPRHEATCVGERARVLFERGETDAALEMVEGLTRRLTDLYSATKPPDRDLMLGSVQALGALYGFNETDPEVSQAVLDRLIDFNTQAIADWPEETGLRDFDESAVDLKLDALYASDDRPAIRALLERSIELRARQSMSTNDQQRRSAVIEHAQYLLRLAILWLEDDDPDQSIARVDAATAALEPLKTEGFDALQLALLSARLEGVRAAALHEMGDTEAGRITARSAISALQSAMAEIAGDDARRSEASELIGALEAQAR